MMILSQYHIFELDTINIYSVCKIGLTDKKHMNFMWLLIGNSGPAQSLQDSMFNRLNQVVSFW